MFVLSLRPETPPTSVAYYLFPTSFQDIGHIAEQLIGQTPSGFEAEIIEVQQKSGTCQEKLPSKCRFRLRKRQKVWVFQADLHGILASAESLNWN